MRCAHTEKKKTLWRQKLQLQMQMLKKKNTEMKIIKLSWKM